MTPKCNPSRPSVSDESTGRSKKRKSSNEGVSEEVPVKSKKGKNMDTFRAKLLEVGDDISKIANMLLERNNDTDACMKKLNTLGWEKTDARYQTTLLLFGENANIRRLFLLLDPQTIEIWVKNAGRKYGLFGS